MKAQEFSHQSIALLIDADNAPAAKIDFIIAELATNWVVDIRRAYGNWKKTALSGWEKVLFDYAIQPVQNFDLVKGKNASDMSLVIDAMDILYTTATVKAFCLVSSDCDFTPLCTRLRAAGKEVIGFGDHKAPAPFVNSCSRFLFLDEDEEARRLRKDTKASTEQLKRNSKLVKVLRTAVESAEDDDGWAQLGPVGSHISNQIPFDQRNYGFSKLSDLFSAIDLFEVKKVKNPNGGTSTFVRLKKGSKKKNAS